MNSLNFKSFHAYSYTYTKSFCSTTVREILEIAPFIPMEQELSSDVQAALDHFSPVQSQYHRITES